MSTTATRQASPDQPAPSRPRDRLGVIQRLLTALLVLLAVGLAVAGVNPMPLVLGFVPFAVIHGVRRYGWHAFSAYAAITLVVSFSLENLSIATGFPFGHYHYTAQGIPYLGKVPVQIGVIYVALGYVCWITASALLDGADQRLGDRTNPARRVDRVALPALAAALMASFDLGSDSAASTVGHRWIWEQGGGVFGVPWTNYAGWWLVTFLSYQGFAVILAGRHQRHRRAGAVGREPLAQAAVLYLLLGLSSIPAFLRASAGTVIDATGAAWSTHALFETLMTANLFGAVLLALLALTRLARNDLARYETSAQPPGGRAKAPGDGPARRPEGLPRLAASEKGTARCWSRRAVRRAGTRQAATWPPPRHARQ